MSISSWQICDFWRGIRYSGQKSRNPTSRGQHIEKTNLEKIIKNSIVFLFDYIFDQFFDQAFDQDSQDQDQDSQDQDNDSQDQDQDSQDQEQDNQGSRIFSYSILWLFM